MPIACLALAALVAFGVRACNAVFKRSPRQARRRAAVARRRRARARPPRAGLRRGRARRARRRAYAAIRGDGRLLELPVFRPDVHFGSAYLAYARQSPRERPQGYSTLAPPAADRLARELRGALVRARHGAAGLGVRYVAVHRGLYAQSGFFGRSCPQRAEAALVAAGWRLVARDGPIATYERRLTTAASDVRAAAARRERARDGGEVRPPELLGERRQDVVPDRREARPELRHPRRARDEPEVEVRAAVAPAADVHAADLADGVDGALDPDEQRPELGREVRPGMSPRSQCSRGCEDHDHGQPARLLERRSGSSARRSRSRPRRPAGIASSRTGPRRAGAARRPAGEAGAMRMSPSNGNVSQSASGGHRQAPSGVRGRERAAVELLGGLRHADRRSGWQRSNRSGAPGESAAHSDQRGDPMRRR